MRVLTESDVQAAVGMTEAVTSVSDALREHASGRTDAPLRAEIRMLDRGVLALFMPGHVPAARALGHKLVAEFPDNRQRGLPTLTGSLTLLDYTTGLVAAVMGATYLTNLRTGALTAVAAAHLAPAGARVACVLGTGGLVPAQVWGLATALELDEVRIWGRRPERAARVVEEASAFQLDNDPEVTSVAEAQDAVSGADVIVTATSARSPILDDGWIGREALVCAMGSNAPDMQELPTSLVARAGRVVADSVEGVVDRAGDIVVPVREGRLDRSAVEELSDLVAGTRPDRRAGDGIIVFKSCGFAVLDVALAAQVLQRAEDRDLGTTVPLEQEES